MEEIRNVENGARGRSVKTAMLSKDRCITARCAESALRSARPGTAPCARNAGSGLILRVKAAVEYRRLLGMMWMNKEEHGGRLYVGSCTAEMELPGNLGGRLLPYIPNNEVTEEDKKLRDVTAEHFTKMCEYGPGSGPGVGGDWFFSFCRQSWQRRDEVHHCSVCRTCKGQHRYMALPCLSEVQQRS